MSGFSFVEVLLSVFLVTAGLIVVVQLISKSLSQTLDIRNQIIAAELSQEGIELIRNIRDNNWLHESDSPTPSSTFFYFPSSSDSYCRIDQGYSYVFPNGTNIGCGQGSDVSAYELKLNGNNFYVHNGTTDTKFYRKISISYDANPPNATRATITSMVVWGGASSSFQTIDNCNTPNKCAYTQVTLGKWGE